ALAHGDHDVGRGSVSSHRPRRIHGFTLPAPALLRAGGGLATAPRPPSRVQRHLVEPALLRGAPARLRLAGRRAGPLSGVVARSVTHAQVLFLHLDLQPTELAVVARVVRDEAEDVLRAQGLEDPIVDP